MVAPTYNIVSNTGEGHAGATVIFSDGSVLSLTDEHANYAVVIQALLVDKLDEEEIRELLNPTIKAGASLKALSERVRYDDGHIYFDGDALDDSLARHIVRIIQEGGDENKYGALVKFLEKLYTNPSEDSRKSLYDFIIRQNITILPDGDFIAYKGLNSNGTSIHSGYGIVDGVVFPKAHLKNEIGSVIEIPRSKVDANTAIGCSTGLHAGSYSYASDFAQGLLVTVSINPRDVVSVPEDCNYQKIRTARYTVLATTVQEIKHTTWDEDEENDWDEDYSDEDYEECIDCGAELNSDGTCTNQDCENFGGL